MKIESFTSRDRDRIHATNGLVSLTNLPYSSALVSDKVLWKLMVKVVVCTSSNEIRILISLEPTQQLSVLDIVDHIL